MKILAIGDPHLGNLEKMIERFHYPPNYMEQLAKNISSEVPLADLLLIAGDLVWNNDFIHIIEELKTLQALQARHICFIDGNHDWPWLLDLSKMYELYNLPSFFFLSGRTIVFDNVGICGACGTTRESPRKTRELNLLQNSLNELASKDIDIGICLMHYPPSSQIFKDPDQSFAEDTFFSLIEESGIIDKVVFGHIHKDQQFKINLYLKIDDIELYSVAIDYFDWHPVRIL